MRFEVVRLVACRGDLSELFLNRNSFWIQTLSKPFAVFAVSAVYGCQAVEMQHFSFRSNAIRKGRLLGSSEPFLRFLRRNPFKGCVWREQSFRYSNRCSSWTLIVDFRCGRLVWRFSVNAHCGCSVWKFSVDAQCKRSSSVWNANCVDVYWTFTTEHCGTIRFWWLAIKCPFALSIFRRFRPSAIVDGHMLIRRSPLRPIDG